MANRKRTFGRDATIRQPNLVGVKKTVPRPAMNPNAISFGQHPSLWPDGSIKVYMPDGTLLPQGTQVHVTASGTEVTDAAGNPIQHIGPHGQTVYNPVTDATTLAGVDPAIGYEAGSANRGLGYANQDYNTNWAGFSTGAAGQVVRPGDLTAQNPDGSYKYGRGVQDYFQSLDRSNQDYGTATSDLQHQYQIQGNNQLQAINQAGELGGGALAQALAKRTANQAHDQSGLDTTHSRGLADLLSGTSRSVTDAYTGLQRNVGENAAYQATLQQQAAQQAGPGLVDNPNYEVVGNNIYVRMPDGSLKATGKTTGSGSGGSPSAPKAPAVKSYVGDPYGRRRAQSFGAKLPPRRLGY